MYRPQRTTSLRSHLNILLAIALGVSLVCMHPAALADDWDWPDPVYFPPPKPASATEPHGKPAGNVSNPVGGNAKSTPEKSGKKGWRPFAKKRGKAQSSQAGAQTEDDIVQVGPKDPLPSSDPLLRLPVSIRTEHGVIRPGYYLVRQLNQTGHERTLTLIRQSQPLFRFSMHAVGEDSHDSRNPQPKDVPEVSKTSNRERAPHRIAGRTRVEARLSADRKTVVLRLTDGSHRYESPPFPVAEDTRMTPLFGEPE